MFRKLSSLSFSLLIHTLLFAGLFYTYEEVSSISKVEKAEHKVCMALSCLCNAEELSEEKQSITQEAVVAKAIEKPQKLEKPIVKPKKAPKPIIKEKPKKEVPKKVKKTVPFKEAKKVPEEKVEEVVVATKTVGEEKPQEKLSQKESQGTLKQGSATSKKGVGVQGSQHLSQKGAQQAYVNDNISVIVKLLQENLYYPRSARKRALEGVVLVKFTLSTEAKVTSLEVISSKHSILSRGAIETIESLSGKFPKPKEELELSVPISYNLRR